MRIPIGYKSDRKTAERIILEATGRYTTKTSDLGEEALR